MSEQEPSGNAYRQLAGRLADVIEGVGRQAERVLMEAEGDAARVVREARAEAARVSREAQEESDRVLTRLADRRDALMRHIKLLDDQLTLMASEVERIMEELSSEEGDHTTSLVASALPEEADPPLVLPERVSPEDESAPGSPEASELTRSVEHEVNGEVSTYIALWGLDAEANKEDPAKR
jgi:cell division septum initiation protein DivIVA